jgi:hypothetical protein
VEHLPFDWWKAREKCPCGCGRLPTQHEADAHGSLAQAAKAHGITPSRAFQAWSALGLPKRQGGTKSLPIEPALMEEPPDQTEVLRERLRQAEAHIRKQRTGEVQWESVADRIIRAIPAVIPTYKAPKLVKSKQDPQEAVLMLGDFHASEIVDADRVLGMNSYDWPTMVHRMGEVQRAAVSHIEHAGFPVSRLVICLMGDMLSGDIHDELAITNDRPTAQAVVDLAYELAAFVEQLVPHVPKIHIAGVPGNHPRLSKKPQAKQAANNGDWLMYKLLEARLAKYPSVTFEFPFSAYARITVAERWKVLLMHGDGIRSSMPGVPWGGISRRVASLLEQFGAAQVAVDYIFCGHFHTANALDGVSVETIMNGSLKGVDEYSLSQFGGGRRAKQRLAFFHRERGITGLQWIDLQETIPMAERVAC